MSSVTEISIPAAEPEVLVRVENVGKIFCRDLKKSLLYGLKDSIRDLIGGGRSKSSGQRQLRKDEFWANEGVSFELRRGECLGMIGHNGAGKTTLLKMLNGLIKPDAGRIEMHGRIGALIALGAGFNPILTGRENIYINGSVLGCSRDEIDNRLDEIVDFAEMRDAIDSPVANYSSGMQVRLGFAVASALEPEVLLVDEVLAVGDNAFQKKCYERIYELKRKGVSIIVVSHNPYQLERLCEKVAVLDHGKLVCLTDGKDAILEYHKRLTTVPKKVDGQVAHQREGTGEVVLNELCVLHPDGTPAEPAHTGEALVFEFRCFSDIQRAGVRLRAEILSDSNVAVANIASNAISEEWTIKGDFVIRLQIPCLRLLTGAYSIDVYVGEDTGKRFDTRKGIARLEVQTINESCILQTGLNGIYHEDALWAIRG